MSKAKNQDPVHVQPGSAFEIPGSVTDDDASDIDPALSEQEWAAWRSERLNPVTMMRDVSAFPPNPDNLVKTIALAFDQLHDEDVRKIARRETVELLRAAAERFQTTIPEVTSESSSTTVAEVSALGETYSMLHELADAIECYLPEDA